MGTLLDIENMRIEISTQFGVVKAVRGVSFSLMENETLAIVGESGSGKSITVKGVMRLLPPKGRIVEGNVSYGGRDLASCSERQMRGIRGSDISMIFQDPMTSLNPTMTAGKQILEVLKQHRSNLSGAAMKDRAIELLSLVGIANPERRYGQYPHQLSGGMRQRIVIAIALACDPKILIADEPTTALDVTIQAQIIDLMRELQRKIGMSIILITHNLGVVAHIADRVAVMYGGKIVEVGGVREVFYEAGHPYTRGLLESMPGARPKGQRLASIPGTPPDLMSPPPGCPFAARCPDTMLVCQRFMPESSGPSRRRMARPAGCTTPGPDHRPRGPR